MRHFLSMFFIIAIMISTTACSRGGGGDPGGGDTKIESTRINPMTYLSGEMALKVDLNKCVKGTILAYSRSGGGVPVDLCSRAGVKHVLYPVHAGKNALLEAKIAYENESKQFSFFNFLPEKARQRVKKSLKNALMQARSTYWGPLRRAPAVLAWYWSGKKYPTEGSKEFEAREEIFQRLESADQESIMLTGHPVDYTIRRD